MRFLPLNPGVLLLLAATALPASATTAAADSPALDIVAQSPQTIAAGENFHSTLVAQGGFAPYTWHVAEGTLPPGLKLHAHKGVISGVPATPGEYHFKLAVTDSNVPQQQAQRDFTIIVIAALTIDWKQPPKVQGNTISGSVVVSNQTGHPLQVTVIVVAVNSIGRATALGYQHFTLEAQKSSPVIPFSASPGPQTYMVRADVAAQGRNGHHVFRASKRTPNNLEVTQI